MHVYDIVQVETLFIMESNLKIGTWNLCLGLANKKDIVTVYLKTKEISICRLQETEIPVNYPEKILNCNDYVLELETCDNDKNRELLSIWKKTLSIKEERT